MTIQDFGYRVLGGGSRHARHAAGPNRDGAAIGENRHERIPSHPKSTSRWLLITVTLFAFATPVFADSKSETPKPPSNAAALTEQDLRQQLETEYRAALETRLAQEKASYEGSLRSLWMSSAAVWGVLLVFIAMQALSARKRAAELQGLRAAREGG